MTHTEIKITEPIPALKELIKKKRGLPEVIIDDLMRYNVMTINQVAALPGKSLSAINSLIRPRHKKDGAYTVLTPTYPFPELVLETGEPDIGRVFILRDEAFYTYLNKELSGM